VGLQHRASVRSHKRLDFIGLQATSIGENRAFTSAKSPFSWKLPHGTVTPVPLGRTYAEEFRHYLLGRTAFPQHVALSVMLSSLEGPLMSSSIPNGGRVAGSHHGYQFEIPGLVFTVAVGKMIPESMRVHCFVRGYGNPVIISRTTDQAVWARLRMAARHQDWTNFFSRYGPPKSLTEL
jgi:hypothetical protein